MSDAIRRAVESSHGQLYKQIVELRRKLARYEREEQVRFLALPSSGVPDLTAYPGSLAMTAGDGRVYYGSLDGDWLPIVGAGMPYATKVVAASNSSATSAASADFVCDGTQDDVEIQAAIDSLPDGGLIILLDGTYTLSGSIELASLVSLRGAGPAATVLVAQDLAAPAIDADYEDDLTGLPATADGYESE
jgi:hypothetical protein